MLYKTAILWHIGYWNQVKFYITASRAGLNIKPNSGHWQAKILQQQPVKILAAIHPTTAKKITVKPLI